MAITLNGTTGITTPGLIADSPTLTVDSANNRVGINTTAPANELEVWGTGTVALFSGSGGSGFIGIHDRDDGTLGFIGVDGGTLKFQTSGSSYSDKLVITSAGNVGIGSTNPTEKLQVVGRITSTSAIRAGTTSPISSSGEFLSILGQSTIRLDSATNAATYLINADTTSNTIQPYLFCNDTAGNRLGLGVEYSSAIATFYGHQGISLQTGTTAFNYANERLRITSTGNVGIGITNPTNKLQVSGNAYASSGLGTYAKEIFHGTGYTGTPGSTGFTAKTDVDGSTTLSAGYHYIYRLTTKNTSTDTGACYIVYYREGYNTWVARYVGRNGSSSNHCLLRINGNTVEIYTNHAGEYQIYYSVEKIIKEETDGTPHFLGSDYHWQRNINDLFYGDGDVNIGDPYVTANTNDAVGSKSLYFPGAGWNTSSGSVAVGTQLISTHGYWSGNYSNSFGQTYPDFKIRIKNSDSADYVEKFAFSGNGVMRIAPGGGINFSNYATSGNPSSNLLDDYEEGTWTPIVTNLNGGTTFNATPQNTTGYYIKVGSKVTAWYYSSTFNVNTNGSGAAVISGFPFNSTNQTNSYAPGIMTHTNCFTSDVENGYFSVNNNYFVPTINNSTGSTTWATGSTVYFMVSVTYWAA